MKARPILFTTDLVRDIFDGTKKHTLRPVKHAALRALRADMLPAAVCDPARRLSPFGYPGDVLWVRETYADLRGLCFYDAHTGQPMKWAYGDSIPMNGEGDAFRKRYGIRYKPAMFMPRMASRLSVRMTALHIGRLQDLYKSSELWDALYGAGAYDANPWVWVIGFEPINAGEK